MPESHPKGKFVLSKCDMFSYKVCGTTPSDGHYCGSYVCDEYTRDTKTSSDKEKFFILLSCNKIGGLLLSFLPKIIRDPL